MARKSETRRIGDLDVTVNQFKPTTAYHVIASAMKTLGPVLGTVVPALAAGGLGALMSMNASSLGAAFATLDVDAADRLLVELLKGTSVLCDRNGKRVQYDLGNGKNAIDDAFEEDGLPGLFGAVKFAVEVNFSGFTKSAAGLEAPAVAPGAGTP